MRCKHCGADFYGGRCVHCGSDEFVDVEEHYNAENVVTYRTGSANFHDASSRSLRARVL
jgi:hypothetical protein